MFAVTCLISFPDLAFQGPDNETLATGKVGMSEWGMLFSLHGFQAFLKCLVFLLTQKSEQLSIHTTYNTNPKSTR